MDLRHVATFRAIVEAGSFARAAERLGIGPSTVTLHVQRLEAELGGPVFVRRGRRLDLTDLGAALRRHGDAVAGHLDALRQEAAELAGAVRGTLRVGAVEPAAHLDVAPLLAAVARGRDHVRIRLDVGGTGLLAAGVAAGRLAFALCSAPPAALDLTFEPLFHEPIGLLVPDGHEAAAREGAVAATSLAGWPLLVSEPGCAYRARALGGLRAAGVDLDVRGEIAGREATVAAVRAGLGVALVPLADLSPAAPAGTAVRRIDGVDLALAVGIVRPRAGEAASPLARRALDAIRASAPTWRAADGPHRGGAGPRPGARQPA
ncbi:MAG TPA: LysR family transcriptional regulator [Acidimicrobiales bacterium]